MPLDDLLACRLLALEPLHLAGRDPERLHELDPAVWRVDGSQRWVQQERQPDKVGRVVGPDGTVGRNPVVLLEPPAGLEDVPGKVVEQVEHPIRLFGGRQQGGQPERHLEPESAALPADALLVVVERRVPVRAEVQVGDAAVPALIGADAVERVRATEHVLDDAAPVSRLLLPVYLTEPGVDGIPSGAVLLRPP